MPITHSFLTSPDAQIGATETNTEDSDYDSLVSNTMEEELLESHFNQLDADGQHNNYI